MNDLCLFTELYDIYIKFIIKTCKLEGSHYILKDRTRCYGFIPYTDVDFLFKDLKKIYNRLYKKTGCAPKFMDIGCGIGNIVLLASLLGYRATGLEYNSKICKTAKQLCNVNNERYCFPTKIPIEIIKGDMRKFKHYGEYDVLYYYQPMANYKAMNEFSINLFEQMKSGAYLICIGTKDSYRKPKGFYQVGKSAVGKKPIWRKK